MTAAATHSLRVARTIRATHERFAGEQQAAGHEKGWTQLLALLERAVA